MNSILIIRMIVALFFIVCVCIRFKEDIKVCWKYVSEE